MMGVNKFDLKLGNFNVNFAIFIAPWDKHNFMIFCRALGMLKDVS